MFALQDMQEVGEAGCVQAACDGHGLFPGNDGLGKALPGLLLTGKGGEGAFGLGQGGQDGLFIDGQRRIPLGRADLDPGPGATLIEKGQIHGRAYRPVPAAGGDQTGKIDALQAHQGRQGKTGKEIGGCDPDPGGCGGQPSLDCADVWPLSEKIRGHGYRYPAR